MGIEFINWQCKCDFFFLIHEILRAVEKISLNIYPKKMI